MKEFERNIRRVEPYVPGEQPRNKVVKLNTNENPYPPSPRVLEAMKEMEKQVGNLRLYPDPTSESLVSALAKEYQVGKDQVFVGVGSDDVLAMCFLTFFNSKKPIFFPDITYSFYKVWAELYQIPYECKPVDETFRIRKEDYYGENGGIIFPNPNAPTSIYENLEFVEDILRHNPDVIVIVDEAYIDFAGESAIRLLDRYENLVITQTFSKARSMAGMRIGYAIASPLLIRYLNDVKYSFNSYTMNAASLRCGVCAVEDKVYFQHVVNKIIETRNYAEEEFRKLGFHFPKPSGNFIFVSHPEYDASALFQAMKEAGIYVRHWDQERIKDYLRVTIGTQEEMERLFEFLRDYRKER